MNKGDPNRPLLVLHLEDNEPDWVMVRDNLRRGGLKCEIRVAKLQSDFEAALREEIFELILSDYTLPSYDGEAALTVAKKIQPETPFLYVSGTMGEEKAVESLKRGAIDCVLKGRMDRLVPAVERALREAEEHRRRREAEAKYQIIFENALEGIFQAAPDGRLLTANPAMARLCGYDSPHELIDADRKAVRQFYVNPQRRAEIERLLREHGEVPVLESQVRQKNGHLIWIVEHLRAVRDAHGGLLHYEGTMADITARKEMEEALRASEERFREMAESLRDVFWVVSPDGSRLLYVSPAYEQTWGRTLAEFHTSSPNWLETIVSEDRALVQKALARLAEGTEYKIQYRLNRPDGKRCWIEDRGYPVYDQARRLMRILGMASDITERKDLEAQLLQSQKMEAIGQLAGGVAHDFNNMLTIINGYSRLLLDQGQLPAQSAEQVRRIYAAGVRAGNLTRQLLLFSRKHATNRQAILLNPNIEEIAKLVRSLIGEHIRLELHLGQELPPINADVGMIEQVLLNLVVNARDAMPKGGLVTITTELVNLDDGQAANLPARRPGKFICLSVRDTGGGIAPEVRSRIFEPFFTTKPAGMGTGLGLATVFGIVQQHEGWLEVESEVGSGTCFKIFLPPVVASVTDVGKSIHPFAGRGSETVLLVEDEAPVRELGVAILEHFGYRVLQAASGVQALEVWKWHAPRISMLLTDLVMPDGMTGAELAKNLQTQKPALKVVYTSGYTSEMTARVFGLQREGIVFLQKPYTPASLASVVRKTMDQEGELPPA